MATENAPSKVRWQIAGFLAFADALNYADRAAISSVLPALRLDLALSDVELGMLGSAFLCVAVVIPGRFSEEKPLRVDNWPSHRTG